MRVADYIVKFLSDKGIDTIFMITGGQAMFLNDAVYQNRQIKAICMHHEQAVGMAAEAYGRFTGKIGVALVTAGPGAINVMSGVVGAWVDSAPMIVISGQSALFHVQYEEKTKIRQYGVQGINIKPLVEDITKYFVTVDDPDKIAYYMNQAYHFATTGRQGPVWIEVPLNLQGREIPSDIKANFVSTEAKIDLDQLKKKVSKVVKLICRSKRPIFLAGQGVRLSKGIGEFNQFVKKVKIPILTSRLGIDLISSDDPLYVGRPGTYGERAANFAVQNADLILSIGCRLATPLIGHDSRDFGRNAKKVVVDIDKKELNKPNFIIDIKVNVDAKIFLQELLRQTKKEEIPDFTHWVKKCNSWKERYPVVLPFYKDEKPVNSYYFIEKLSSIATKNDVVLVDTGGCFHVASQAWKIKNGQRFLTTGGISTMGYWAAGIGVCLANKNRRTIVITGDGSLQMNIQEFATIKHNKLPVKVFIFNNNGYLLIRHTQKNFMQGRLIGESPNSGIWFPDAMEVAKTYKIKGVRITTTRGIEKKIKKVLQHKGPVICEIMTPQWQLLIPRTASKKQADGTMISMQYEDMFPFLKREELVKNMIVAERKSKKLPV